MNQTELNRTEMERMIDRLHARLTRLRKRFRRLKREMGALEATIESIGWDVADAVGGDLYPAPGTPSRVDVETGQPVEPINGTPCTPACRHAERHAERHAKW